MWISGVTLATVMATAPIATDLAVTTTSASAAINKTATITVSVKNNGPGWIASDTGVQIDIELPGGAEVSSETRAKLTGGDKTLFCRRPNARTYSCEAKWSWAPGGNTRKLDLTFVVKSCATTPGQVRFTYAGDSNEDNNAAPLKVTATGCAPSPSVPGSTRPSPKPSASAKASRKPAASASPAETEAAEVLPNESSGEPAPDNSQTLIAELPGDEPGSGSNLTPIAIFSGGAAFIVLGGLLVWWIRRRDSDDEDEDEDGYESLNFG